MFLLLGAVMSQDQPPVAVSVEKSIVSGKFGDADEGLMALVRRYAYELDAAAIVEAEFDDLIETGEFAGRDYQRLQLLERRVRAATTVADVGPKLLAALESLGLSPAARAKLSKGLAPPADPGSGPKSALAGLRDEVADRRAAKA
jgi:hypothetical protein